MDDYSSSSVEKFRTFENLEALRRQGIVELDASWNIKSVASGREMLINPREVRFTQEWVSYNSSDKINTLDSTGRDAKVSPEKLPPLDVVVMPDGRLTSMDNRRLAAAYLYDAENVRVTIHASTDRLADTAAVKRFTWGGRTSHRPGQRLRRFASLSRALNSEKHSVKVARRPRGAKRA